MLRIKFIGSLFSKFPERMNAGKLISMVHPLGKTIVNQKGIERLDSLSCSKFFDLHAYHIKSLSVHELVSSQATAIKILWGEIIYHKIQKVFWFRYVTLFFVCRDACFFPLELFYVVIFFIDLDVDDYM